MQLVWRDSEPMFDFDEEDKIELYAWDKVCHIAGMTVTVQTLLDIKIINSIKLGKMIGPMQKFALINLINLPLYIYFYHQVRTQGITLK